MWGILNTLNSSDVDEVTIDSGANWKATKTSNNTGIKVSIYHIIKERGITRVGRNYTNVGNDLLNIREAILK